MFAFFADKMKAAPTLNRSAATAAARPQLELEVICACMDRATYTMRCVAVQYVGACNGVRAYRGLPVRRSRQER